MIFFGTRGVTTTPEKGVFHCPACGPGSNFRWRRVRKFFTLYFIPIIPLNQLGEYIECDHCKGTYDLNVLQYDPEKIAQDFEAEYHKAVRKVMITMVLADGQIDDAESQMVCTLYQELTGRPMFPGDVHMEASDQQTSGASFEVALGSLAGSLNTNGKERVIEAAWRVAHADGEFHETEQALLARIAGILELSSSHYQGLLHTLSSQGRLPEPTPPPLPG
ncbi:TerB family tellurite resistance protein [Haloferula sp.]|uniref:TerB family tellurite resistance protein n=1 Tax=Haloferula sp. TaxID=2497595 RepID=UPI00329E5446